MANHEVSTTMLDISALSQEAVRAGLIDQDVLDHLTSLHPQVPNSMKHRYLLMQVQDTVKYNQELEAKMTKLFLDFGLSLKGTINSAKSEEDVLLGPEHIPKLIEFLVRFASRWRLIGTALNFQPEDLNNIQAKNATQVHPLQHIITTMVTDWINGSHFYTLAPTLNNIKKALRSETVGLGRESELLESIAWNSTIPPPNQVLPYAITSILSLDDAGGHSATCTSRQVQVGENISTLLEVQVTATATYQVTATPTYRYTWLKDGKIIDDKTYRGTKTPILCISHSSIDVDGCKFSCQIEAIWHENLQSEARYSRSSPRNVLIETPPITLTVTCPLDKFRESLASIYLAQPEVPEDTWPPVSSKRYVNLAVIKQQNIKYGAKYARLTVRGDIDDILQHKDKVTYEEVLHSFRSGVTIFIEGRPGCGKTTFVHKISRDWANRLSRGALKLVLLVSLRVLNKPNLDLTDILKLGLFQNLKINKELIEERNGKGVCFIFDGLDEFLTPDKKKSTIFQLINRYYLTESTIIVASRPAATAELRGKADSVIEIIGFQNDQIFEYFKYYPFTDTSKIEKLKTYLQSHLNILHMCYLPIHTVMVAFLFEHTGKVPRTETEVYKQFACLTLLRSLSKSREIEDINVENLSEEDERLFNHICAIALQKTIMNIQVLHNNEIKSHFQCGKVQDFSLGLITIERTAGLLGIKDMYTFLHLTFQEYLAAYRISTLSDKIQHKLIEAHGCKIHMQVVWKFYCGLVSSDENIRKVMSRTENDFLKCHCAYESQTSSASRSVLQQNNKLDFREKYLTTSDFTAIGHVVASAIEPFSLNFSSSCNINTEKVDALLSEAAGKHLLIHSLVIGMAHMESDERECLRRLIANTKSLKCLQLSLPFSDTGTKFDMMSKLLTFCTDLTKLTLQGIPIHHKTLEAILIQCRQLQFLSLVYNTGTDEMKVLAACLPRCVNLLELDIYCENKQPPPPSSLEVPGAMQTTLAPCTERFSWLSLKKVTINECVNVNAAAEGLASTLCRCKNIELLDLNENRIGSSGGVILFTKIHTMGRMQSSLTVVDLGGNRLGREGAHAVSKCLKYWPNLRKLDLSSDYYNPNIDCDGAMELAENLHHCIQLTHLNLSRNNINTEIALRIVSSLINCTNLSKLDLSHNFIKEEYLDDVLLNFGKLRVLIIL